MRYLKSLTVGFWTTPVTKSERARLDARMVDRGGSSDGIALEMAELGALRTLFSGNSDHCREKQVRLATDGIKFRAG